MDDVTSQGGGAAAALNQAAEGLVYAALQQAWGELGGRNAGLGSSEAPLSTESCDVHSDVRVNEFPLPTGVPADDISPLNPAFEDTVMGGGPGHQARDVVERQQQTPEAAAGAGQQPRQHRDEERTEQQQHSGVEGASRIRTTSAEGHPVEALIEATVGSFGQSDVQPESVAVELSVGPDDTVAVNLAPVWEQDVNAAFRLDVGLGETLTVNLALAEEQHVASEAVTQEEEGDRAAQNMGQGFQAALPGYDAVDSFQQPLLNWRPAAGLGKATSAGAPGKQLPTGLQATRKQISPVARDAKVAASISGRLPPTKQANGSDGEERHRPGPKPLVRPKPGNMCQNPPSLRAVGAQQSQGQVHPRLSGSPLPAVLPAGWVETTNAESERERQGGYSASYGVADFTGLEWGPHHESSPIAEGIETITVGGTSNMAMMSSGGGLSNGQASPRQHKNRIAASTVASPLLPQEGQAYSVLQRKCSLNKGALERGQPGYAEVKPDAMFQEPPSPQSLGLQGDSPVYEEVAPVEAPPPRKPVSKPSVSEILAKAGVKLKPKQEQGGPRTAPPRQQTMSRGMPPLPAGFPQQLMDPRAAPTWSASNMPGVPDGQQFYTPVPRQLGPYTAMTGSPAAGTHAPQWVSQDQAPAQGFPNASHQVHSGQPPQQQQWQQEGEGYSIAASWPPYEGARLPALSPDATYPPDGGMAASGPGLMPWNPAGVVYPGHYAAAYGVMPYGSSPMAAGAPSSAWYGPPVEAGGPYGNSLPPLPGSAAAAAAWMAGQAQYAGQQASWPAPTHAPMYDPRQQQPPQQQLYKAQGKVRPTVPRQHGVFIARPSKVFHGLQARSRHQPQKYQDDGRPAFSLK